MQDALHVIFTAIVLSVVTYALPSFAGQLSQSDKARINSLFRKAFKRGLCNTQLNIDDLIDTAVQSADTIDSRLFHQMLWDKQYHCLVLTPITSPKTRCLVPTVTPSGQFP